MNLSMFRRGAGRLCSLILLFAVLSPNSAQAKFLDRVFSNVVARITVYKPGTKEVESVIEFGKPLKNYPSQAVFKSKRGLLSPKIKESFSGTIDEVWLPTSDVKIEGKIPESVRVRRDDPNNRTLVFSAHWNVYTIINGIPDPVSIPFGVINAIDDLRVTQTAEAIELAFVIEGKRYIYDRLPEQQGLFLRQVVPLNPTAAESSVPDQKALSYTPQEQAAQTPAAQQESPVIHDQAAREIERRQLEDLDLKLSVMRHLHELEGADDQNAVKKISGPQPIGEAKDRRFTYEEVDWNGQRTLMVRDTERSNEVVRMIKVYGPYTIKHLRSGATLIEMPLIGKRMIFSRPNWQYHFSQDMPRLRCSDLFR